MRKTKYLKEKKHTSIFMLLLTAFFVTACQTDAMDSAGNNQHFGSAHSIFINNGKLFISGYTAHNNQLHTQYWTDSEIVDQLYFEEFVDIGTLYREAVDEKSRTVYTYKNTQGEIQKYQFDQGSLSEGGSLFFYENDVMKKIDTTALGTLSAITFFEDQPYYVGYFGKIQPTVAGESLSRETPFIWNGNSFNKLPLPPQAPYFQGTSTLYIANQNEFYVGGLVSFPMYWKNLEPIILDSRYGEVWQITTFETDVYAVGLINKHHSNSTGHTACYWKNQNLIELDDNAQAYSIFIDAEGDVYVSGAIGRTPIDYKPCYWKNGVRVDLPF